MNEPGLRQALVDAARALSASGMNAGTSGNLSARQANGMWITPSAMAFEVMEAVDLVDVSLDGQWAAGRRPSSEWRIHRDIYRAFPQAQAVVHAHPPHCVALASHGRGIPAFHYTVALAGGTDIRCAGYATFGTQALSEHVLKALQGRKACLMAQHGMVCFERSPAAALSLAMVVEQLARAYLLALPLGEPPVLDEAEMSRVIAQFDAYHSGQLTGGEEA